MRDFWWGYKDDGKRHLYLRDWMSLCSPKQAGGMSFKLCKEINDALMKKLAWDIVKHPHKTWVKLIRAKYLRGRKLLDYQVDPKGASWIWRGIMANLEEFKTNTCYRVGSPLMLNIWNEPWIPTVPHLRPPVEYRQEDDLTWVHELISEDGKCWDMPTLHALFP